MTTTNWITLVAAIIGGVTVGLVASRIVRGLAGAPNRPTPIRRSAPALASLALWSFVVVGLIAALGVVSPSALDQLPKDVIAFVPRLLSAAIVVIIANVASSFATASLAPVLGRMPSNVQRQVLSVVRTTIIGLAVLLAVRQIGFDTTVINLAAAAIFFGIAATLSLLIALGGRHVATEVASTRALRRLLSEGDQVAISDLSGTVVGVHATAVEILTLDGRVVLAPASRFVTETITVERASSPRQVGSEL